MAERKLDIGLYAISVVAQLVGTGQQNIRFYERTGLLTPDRTAGGTRQHSEADLAVLRRVSALLDAGRNLSAVAKVAETTGPRISRSSCCATNFGSFAGPQAHRSSDPSTGPSLRQ